ncbi:MAG: ABC transporter permease [Pirellulales bacterium]|nr:ABC transporter permease [Pirellulales bacterium]
MKIVRITAVARKEFLHVFRDYRSLMMAIAIPIMMLVLFGYALTLDVDNVPLAVWDQSGTAQSRDFIARFDGSRFFSVRGTVVNQREMDYTIDSGRALGVLVVPRDFAQKLAAGRAAEAQLIIDGSDSNTATIALNYAEAVVQGYSQNLVFQAIRRNGLPEPRQPLNVKPRVWFNEELESKNFIVPGLIAVLMMVIAALLTSLTIAREWEQGTMEQLIATPVKGPELILGKLIPYFAIGLFDVLLAVLMAEFVFHVPLRGSVLFLFSIAVIFLIGALSMGLVISINLKNQLLAAQFAMVATFLPSFLLSGFMFSIANMPHAIQVITYIVPARYFVTTLKGIYMKGVGPSVLFAEVVFLMIYSAIMFTIANVRFKKKLS